MMALEIVQELFHSVAYEDSSGKIALKRFKSRENAEKYLALYEEYDSVSKSIKSMEDRTKDLEQEIANIEPNNVFRNGQILNIIEGDVQCFSK
jgi:hypothetical protein